MADVGMLEAAGRLHVYLSSLITAFPWARIPWIFQLLCLLDSISRGLKRVTRLRVHQDDLFLELNAPVASISTQSRETAD